jgi:hypothetical protein
MNGLTLRWHTILLAAVAAVATVAAVQEHRYRSDISALAAELQAMRADAARAADVAAPATSRLDGADRDALAQAIAARIGGASARSVPQTGGQPPQAGQPAPADRSKQEHEPSDAERAAADEATRVLDSVLGKGTLRREDLVRLRQLAAQADPQASFEIRRRLAVALNRDELRPDDPRALLR